MVMYPGAAWRLKYFVIGPRLELVAFQQGRQINAVCHIVLLRFLLYESLLPICEGTGNWLKPEIGSKIRNKVGNNCGDCKRAELILTTSERIRQFFQKGETRIFCRYLLFINILPSYAYPPLL